MSDHIFRYPDIVVDLSVVDLENQADEIGQDGGTTGLCLDRRGALAWFGSHDRKAVEICMSEFRIPHSIAAQKRLVLRRGFGKKVSRMRVDAYGTM